jgi:hypothetical protein
VTVGGTAIGCSGDCEEWEDSERVGEKQVEAVVLQPSDGQAVAHSAARVAMAGGMEVEDSELPDPLEIRVVAGSGGHTVCASSAGEVLVDFVSHSRLGRSSCAAFRS